ncbi:MAG: nuclear transport factor 2 family protein [Cytophagales bacterium]|nr:nuclear transport factor 2 family protein [Cytophagales bacterium]
MGERFEKQKIVELLSEYQKSLNTSDADLAQSLYTKEGIFMPSGSPTAFGPERILESYNSIFSKEKITVDLSIEEIEIEDLFAFALANSMVKTILLQTGTTSILAKRALFIFEKIEGEWLIARCMLNMTEINKALSF